MTPFVLLATCEEMPDLDDDAQVLRKALLDRGIDARPAVWDDTSVTWSAADLVVLRSTWDYSLRQAEFLDWARGVAEVTTLLNRPDLVTWSSDKHYLLDLLEAGLPVVPSTIVEPGEDQGTHPYSHLEHVVKPTVSAGSKDTYRIDAEDRVRSQGAVQAIHASGRAALIQPYRAAVDQHGETALLYADGVFTHAMRKGALLAPGHDAAAVAGLFLQEEMTVREPSAHERHVGDRVVQLLERRFGETPLYARVDLLPSPDGPEVLEVELVEPSLFLEHVPEAAAPFADAVVARLG